MKTVISTLILFIGVSGMAFDLQEYSVDFNRKMRERFDECGIEFVSPPANIKVDNALYDRNRERTVGYFYRKLFSFNQSIAQYTKLNGSTVAEITFRDQQFISFGNTKNGELARIEDVTGTGKYIRYSCRHHYMNFADFEKCLESAFVVPTLKTYCLPGSL